MIILTGGGILVSPATVWCWGYFGDELKHSDEFVNSLLCEEIHSDLFLITFLNFGMFLHITKKNVGCQPQSIFV